MFSSGMMSEYYSRLLDSLCEVVLEGGWEGKKGGGGGLRVHIAHYFAFLLSLFG